MKKIFIMLILILVINGVCYGTEKYPFERKIEYKINVKLGKTIGNINNGKYKNPNESDLIKYLTEWYLDYSDEWVHTESYYEEIELKEIFIEDEKYYLLTFIVEKNVNMLGKNCKLPIFFNYVIEKKELDKFKSITKEAKPQLIKIKAKYFIYNAYNNEKSINKNINKIIEENKMENPILYFCILPFYEHNVIRFDLAENEKRFEKKCEEIKTKYNEIGLDSFRKIFPLP